jgi:hypothetical protein
MLWRLITIKSTFGARSRSPVINASGTESWKKNKCWFAITMPSCALHFRRLMNSERSIWEIVTITSGDTDGPVAELVGIDGGVVSGVFNLESSDVGASDRRPRHEELYHEV